MGGDQDGKLGAPGKLKLCLFTLHLFVEYLLTTIQVRTPSK